MALLPSGLPDEIADGEDIARFLTSSGHYNSIIVKPGAFLPSPDHRETSTSRHGREPRKTLWRLGRSAAGNRNLHGAAILKAGAVRDAGLQIVPDEPPDRHAVIKGWVWMDNDLEEQKARQKEVALVLASVAGAPLLVNPDEE